MPASTQGSGKRGGKRSTSWAPGQSGNPEGRKPDVEMQKLREMVGPFTQEALNVVVEIMRNGSSDLARLAAAEKIWERSEGKPKQVLEGAGDLSILALGQLVAQLPEALMVLGVKK